MRCRLLRTMVCVSVFLLCGFAVQIQLNGSRFWLWLRLLGSQGRSCEMAFRTPHGEGREFNTTFTQLLCFFVISCPVDWLKGSSLKLRIMFRVGRDRCCQDNTKTCLWWFYTIQYMHLFKKSCTDVCAYCTYHQHDYYNAAVVLPSMSSPQPQLSTSYSWIVGQSDRVAHLLTVRVCGVYQVHIERRLRAGQSLDEPLSDTVLTTAFDRYLRLEVLLNDKVWADPSWLVTCVHCPLLVCGRNLSSLWHVMFYFLVLNACDFLKYFLKQKVCRRTP